ncbi:MAG TPA: sulfite exporter TauE/SafE family protein, partial [Bryobacteraceae bacterium]|nr:sulfite exporter TauE/SafE family protein [Bryobacteraceae bacterium]
QLTGPIALCAIATGVIGSLTGLGGGFILVPLLTLGFGVDIRYAIGASLVAVIATSSGSAAAYVRQGFPNIRIAMFLEIGSTVGALWGAWVSRFLPGSAIAILFGFVLLHSAYHSLRAKGMRHPPEESPDPIARYLEMNSTYPSASGEVSYGVHRVARGFVLMIVAGILSALLGIGSGIVKVIALDRVMGLPFKVSTTTSNFMIGVTAAASAGIYFGRGYIQPGLAMPVALGVLGGSFLGGRILPGARVPRLRLLFSSVLVAVAGYMIYNGAAGRL